MSPSRLLQLPGELREQIYRAALISDSPILLSERSDDASEAARGVKPTYEQTVEPALLRTCHQIRHEALHIFYRDNVFFSATQDVLELWLKAIGPEKANLIRTIRGFRPSVYFNYAWGKALVRRIENDLREKGCALRESVLRMPFGLYLYPGLVFWTNGVEDVVEATRAGVVEHSSGGYLIVDDGGSHDLIGNERRIPILRKLS